MNHIDEKIINNFFKNASITDELSESSIKKYKDSMKKFFSVIDKKQIKDLENDDFNNFIFEMKKNGASNSRIANVISAVKGLLKYIQQEKITNLKVDLDKIRKPRIERKTVMYLSEQEITIFLETIKKDIEKSPVLRKIRMMALVVLLLETGARIGEALSIKINDIDRINMEIPVIGKGKKPRSLYIKKTTIFWIDQYLEKRSNSNEYLFTTLNGESKWKQTDVGRSFRYYRKKSGISKHFVLHTLRHTLATQFALKGVPMPTIQNILGHNRLETTIKYYIGAVEKSMAKAVMQDEYYNFIPEKLIF